LSGVKFKIQIQYNTTRDRAGRFVAVLPATFNFSD